MCFYILKSAIRNGSSETLVGMYDGTSPRMVRIVQNHVMLKRNAGSFWR